MLLDCGPHLTGLEDAPLSNTGEETTMLLDCVPHLTGLEDAPLSNTGEEKTVLLDCVPPTTCHSEKTRLVSFGSETDCHESYIDVECEVDSDVGSDDDATLPLTRQELVQWRQHQQLQLLMLTKPDLEVDSNSSDDEMTRRLCRRFRTQ